MTDSSEQSSDKNVQGGPGPDQQSEPGSPFRAGFVALAGKPNAGKSTLMNAITGEKLAIVTPKAQTTRDRILGIHTGPSCQIAFVDMPGLIEPRDLFNSALMDIARQAMEGVDVILHVVDARDREPAPPEIVATLKVAPVPVALVWTHCDLLKPHERTPEMPAELESVYRGRFAVSATEGFGLGQLVAGICDLLPESPPLYDPDTLTDRNLRFLAGEIVREKIFLETAHEVPYSVAVEVEEFREREEGEPDYIRMTIYVERDSQKQIVIGKGGATLKRIGAAAREEIQRLMDKKVFLDLWVKVHKKWRKKEAELRRLGYWVDKKSGG